MPNDHVHRSPTAAERRAFQRDLDSIELTETEEAELVGDLDRFDSEKHSGVKIRFSTGRTLLIQRPSCGRGWAVSLTMAPHAESKTTH
jgi:hypothetical protein